MLTFNRILVTLLDSVQTDINNRHQNQEKNHVNGQLVFTSVNDLCLDRLLRLLFELCDLHLAHDLHHLGLAPHAHRWVHLPQFRRHVVGCNFQRHLIAHFSNFALLNRSIAFKGLNAFEYSVHRNLRASSLANRNPRKTTAQEISCLGSERRKFLLNSNPTFKRQSHHRPH